jgi:hypothetical protein
VFKDVDSIPLGVNFQKHIMGMIERCSIVLAVIDGHWLTAKTPAGQRRLDDPRDFVRIEIELALQHPDVAVVPLLVQGASMPAAEDLPLTLRDLAFRQGIPIRSDPDFHRDMDRLIQGLQSHFNPDFQA